jgi:hypothetical protein
MISRRLYEHVKTHNWFAVAIDFVIVVIGVFVGIQVSNWNDARALSATERDFIIELQGEIAANNALFRKRADYMGIVEAAGERALRYLDQDTPCREDCWPLLVDFFHASQVWAVQPTRPVYDEMKRLGFPRNKSIQDATVGYYQINHTLLATQTTQPAYRDLARSLIPVEAQRELWRNCWRIDGLDEILVTGCKGGLTEAQARAAVEKLRGRRDVHESLTNWMSFHVLWAPVFLAQAEDGDRAIAVIDRELGRSK